MIKNNLQLEITENSIIRFKQRIEELQKNILSNEFIQMEIDAITSIIQDMEAEIVEYKNIKYSKYRFDTIESFDQIPFFIIGKRIQLDLDDAKLANDLAIDLSYYQWLEDNNFYGIEEGLLNKILQYLNIGIRKNIFSSTNVDKFDTIIENINTFHITNDFLKRTTNSDIKVITEYIKEDKPEKVYLLSRFLEYFKRIFKIDLIEKVYDEKAINNSLCVAFKKPIKIKSNNLNLVTSYAAFIAYLLNRQCESLSTNIKADPITIREEILKQYKEITLFSCIDYIWHLNIPIIPFDIKSGFHGACFNFTGKKVIILNQQHRLVSRWKFDLLHELYHALTLNSDDLYLEDTDIEQQKNKDEIRASKFASFIIFGNEPETFLKIAVDEVGPDIRKLKDSMPSICKRYSLNIDDFSNYAAYRLSMQGISWWGTAVNLQINKQDPFDILSEYFVKNIDFDIYNEFDKNQIMNCITKEEF